MQFKFEDVTENRARKKPQNILVKSGSNTEELEEVSLNEDKVVNDQVTTEISSSNRKRRKNIKRNKQ